VDIACDVSHVADVTISTRSGAYVLPKVVFSRPVDFNQSYTSYLYPWW